jgi:nucleotide-binding universal stress UspA family protein
MRVLFATDGSLSADRAKHLITGLPWPDGTVFSVVYAVDNRAAALGAPLSEPTEAPLSDAEELRRHAEVTLDDAVRSLQGPGRTVDRLILRGRPASAIVEEARTSKADLVVLGSRGHGPIATMVLGSVSAEVVDHVHCPVLVVRGTSVESIVLADDGSAGAERAASIVRAWPILRRLPIDVVSVSKYALPWGASMTAGIYDDVVGETLAEDMDTARAEARGIAERRVDQLVEVGLKARPHLLEGDPAQAIIDFADAMPGRLIVVGTRGHGGLTRLFLGSVARNVLLHALGSVLVVREGVAPAPTEADKAARDLDRRTPVGTR